jgi:hypothetical protein
MERSTAMVALSILLLALGTSAGACVLATRRLRLRLTDLGPAAGQALECIGLAVAFLIANVAIGIGLILTGRALSGQFVSAYLVRDDALVLVSGLQGLIFWSWWRRSRQCPERSDPRGRSRQ